MRIPSHEFAPSTHPNSRGCPPRSMNHSSCNPTTADEVTTYLLLRIQPRAECSAQTSLEAPVFLPRLFPRDSPHFSQRFLHPRHELLVRAKPLLPQPPLPPPQLQGLHRRALVGWRLPPSKQENTVVQTMSRQTPSRGTRLESPSIVSSQHCPLKASQNLHNRGTKYTSRAPPLARHRRPARILSYTTLLEKHHRGPWHLHPTAPFGSRNGNPKRTPLSHPRHRRRLLPRAQRRIMSLGRHVLLGSQSPRLSSSERLTRFRSRS